MSPRKLFQKKESLKASQSSQNNFKSFKAKNGLQNLKDLQKRIEIMNSKGVTPVGANVPLPSTSNFLIGATVPLMGGLVSDRVGQ